MRNLPAPSIVLAPDGTAIAAADPTATMREPFTRTV